MPFCPVHRIEFREGVTHCSENGCNAELVAELPKEEPLEFIDVYECYDVAEAELIVSLLKDAGHEALYRDTISHAFPVTMGSHGVKRILVVKNAAKRRQSSLSRLGPMKLYPKKDILPLKNLLSAI